MIGKCDIHGPVEIIMTDPVLLRYSCTVCLEKIKTTKKAKDTKGLAKKKTRKALKID